MSSPDVSPCKRSVSVHSILETAELFLWGYTYTQSNSFSHCSRRLFITSKSMPLEDPTPGYCGLSGRSVSLMSSIIRWTPCDMLTLKGRKLTG